MWSLRSKQTNITSQVDADLTAAESDAKDSAKAARASLSGEGRTVCLIV